MLKKCAIFPTTHSTTLTLTIHTITSKQNVPTLTQSVLQPTQIPEFFSTHQQIHLLLYIAVLLSIPRGMAFFLCTHGTHTPPVVAVNCTYSSVSIQGGSRNKKECERERDRKRQRKRERDERHVRSSTKPSELHLRSCPREAGESLSGPHLIEALARQTTSGRRHTASQSFVAASFSL